MKSLILFLIISSILIVPASNGNIQYKEVTQQTNDVHLMLSDIIKDKLESIEKMDNIQIKISKLEISAKEYVKTGEKDSIIFKLKKLKNDINTVKLNDSKNDKLIEIFSSKKMKNE